MEGVMVRAATGVVSSLLTKLATLLEMKNKLGKGVEDIAFLIDEMNSMNALLVDLSRMEVLNEQQKEWRDKVRELSYDIEDCVDIFVNDHRGAGKAGPFKKLMASNNVAHRIQELKARVVEASKRHNRYSLDVSISQPCPVAVDPRMEAFYGDSARLVGIDKARDEIIRWLMEGEQQVQQIRRPCFEPWNLSRFLQEWYYYFIQNFCRTPVKLMPSKNTKVISIVGIGGLGKTTLANQAYLKVKSQFDCTAFVSASRTPNMIKILSDIISRVGCSEPSSMLDERGLIERLREFLRDKRYLIVIDDLWTKDAWEIIKSCFVPNNRGSRVVITTRIEDVAQAWYPYFDGHVYRMKPLNDSDSSRLFHTRIFCSEDACPNHLKAVSDEILKKCDGWPLAILCVASILACPQKIKSNENWEKIRDYLGVELERGSRWMRHVFNLSYNDLCQDLRTCMLYLGIFPEDSDIMKYDLVKRWIAEGFIPKTLVHGPEQEETAESYFNELINRNIIQVADMDDCGHVRSCRVHDLMLEFIMLKATEENFVTVINGPQSTRGSMKARRLSLQARNSEGSNHHKLGDMDLIQVRSLNFWGPAGCMPSMSKFQLVRVVHLDVYDCKDEQHDISFLHRFFKLKFLRIRGVGCGQLLIRQLRKLQHLETLEILPGNKRLLEINASKLPSTLRHLVAPSRVKLSGGGIARMKALRTLDELHIDSKEAEKSIKGLGELATLRELKLFLAHSPLSKADCYGVGDLLLSSLCRLSSLQSLVIHGSFEVGEDALTRWHLPPCHLCRLHVLVCPFSTVPTDWITQLDSLRSLEMKVVSLPKDGAEVLARLTSLVHLRLHVSENAPEEGVVIQRGAFPHLKVFHFAHQVPCLVFDAGAMARLEKLSVQCYARAERQADGVLDGIEHLGSLKSCMVDIADFFAIQLQSWSMKGEQYEDVAYQLQIRSTQHQQYEDVPRWDSQALQAALTKAINKHPACLDIRIQSVYGGLYSKPTGHKLITEDQFFILDELF